jgi:protein-disulfide isomerase
VFVVNPLLRRAGLLLALLAAVVLPMAATARTVKPAKPTPAPAAAPAAANPLDVKSTDHVMGDPNAKVTVIEYGSVACPACAHFNEGTFPQFKAKYIDTGKVRYVFRPMLTGVATIAMAGTRMAECAGNDKYFSVVDAIMRGQHEFYATGETDVFARPALVRIAKSYGLDEAAFNACAADPAGLHRLNQAHADALTAGVRGTPTFFVNGKKVDETTGLEDAVTAALPKP